MKLERLNTKVVVAVGIAIILALTLIFIVFNTDIIIKHKKKGNNTDTNSSSNVETVSEEAKDRTKDVDSLNSTEKKYLIEENFLKYLEGLDPTILEQMKKDCVDNNSCPFSIEDLLQYTKEPSTSISGCSGKLSVTFENDKAVVDMSNVSCRGANNSSSNSNYDDPEDPNYNSNEGIPESVKKRTKPVKTLNNDEKLYVVKNNLLEDLAASCVENEKNLEYYQKKCLTEAACKKEANIYKKYSSNSDVGRTISGCTGEVSYIYVPGYVTVTKTTARALEIVADTTKDRDMKTNQIRLKDAKAKNHLNAVNAEIGDYVLKEGNGYVKSTKDTKNSLKVVADTVTPGKDEIKESSVYPYLDTTELKVGDYVREGTFVVDGSKVTCKQG